MQFVDIKKQYIVYKDEIDSAIQKVLDSGCFILGEQVQELEEKLADFVGIKYCIATSNGTDSLLIAMMSLGIGPGDEVITTPFTFVSTASVLLLLGAKPVFVDIDPETYNIDAHLVEEAITSQTKAIVPVSLYGQMADLRKINSIAKRYHLPVLEDGAQSFGAMHYGKKSCSQTTISSTSFFPSKPLGCYGDGGALFTNSDELAEKMKAIRSHGASAPNRYTILGINGRLDTIQAAVLLAKWPHFSEELQKREEIAARYNMKLKDVCQIPKIGFGNTHVYGVYTIRTPHRDELALQLQKKGIPTRIYYQKGIHQQPLFAHLNLPNGSLPETEKSCAEVLSLPMHPWLEKEEQDLIIESILRLSCSLT